MRLLWATALLSPVFGAQAAVVLTTLYSFTGGNDGSTPWAGLVQGSDGNFYGTTRFFDGTNGAGTVFRISPHGALTTVYSFTGGIDGIRPWAGLVQGSDGNFYGTTEGGGGLNGNYGTVFKVSTNGALTSLHSFSLGSDGREPFAGLVQGSDGNFYGTTYFGGASYDGTVFQISTNGAFIGLCSFSGGSDGSRARAALVQGSDGDFYGTTEYGGRNDAGTVFRLTIVPPSQLTLISSGPYVILTWPTNYAGFTLQSTINLASPVWTTNSPAPVIVNGQYAVTNPISGRQQFYRLSQ